MHFIARCGWICLHIYRTWCFISEFDHGFEGLQWIVRPHTKFIGVEYPGPSPESSAQSGTSVISSASISPFSSFSKDILPPSNTFATINFVFSHFQGTIIRCSCPFFLTVFLIDSSLDPSLTLSRPSAIVPANSKLIQTTSTIFTNSTKQQS